ncbi:DUF6484 domain-containing protein [Myxococcus sp. RHSTA-1-4]|uniref:DUF6484 domain-containing protein n=1 Tax=Myxococcus sp. RHSTA-1-4 TaxID=2874601 RepID=UPI001CC036A6|nr:DUF6484 domain-containing protein [Myxococcus sp. RHSTA-1-4]MBZ4415087.1 DUF6484 domain-containing protein [Myxococcus sp. RHSTA-1-4]
MDSSASRGKLARPLPGERIVEPRVGWVVGTTADGSALVDFTGNVAGPLPARSSLALEPGGLARAANERQGAILLFENGDPSLPLLVGLLQAPGSTPLIDAALERSLEDVPKEARVDGRKVVIEGRDEVVLRCGKATLTLRRDGQVLLRGVNIRTEAEEVQRLKGGKVQIN